MIKLELYIAKCKIPTQFNSSYYIKAKLNKHISNSSTIKFAERGILNFNQRLTITVKNTELILEDDKCQVEIFESSKNQLIGKSIVYIRDRKVKQEKQYDKYKVQGGNNNSSSYCQIILYMHSGKDHSLLKKVSFSQTKKSTLRRSIIEQKQKNPFRRAGSFNDREKSQYNYLQNKQQKIEQLNATVLYLKKLLNIQQIKNQKSKQIIKQLMYMIGISQQQLSQGFLKQSKKSKLHQNGYTIVQQQQVSNQEQQQFTEKVQYLQRHCERIQHEKQKFFRQVQELRSKIHNIEDSQQRAKRIQTLIQQNHHLKQNCYEMERKVKETLKAMDSFKKQAISAREQLIEKQSLVQQLSKNVIDKNINPQNKSRAKSLYETGQSLALSKLISSTLKTRQSLKSQLKIHKQQNSISTLGPKINAIKSKVNSHYNMLLRQTLSTQNILKSKSQVLSIIQNQLISI